MTGDLSLISDEAKRLHAAGNRVAEAGRALMMAQRALAEAECAYEVAKARFLSRAPQDQADHHPDCTDAPTAAAPPENWTT